MKSEIEVKAKVDNIDEIVNKLKAIGCAFGDPLIQHDYIYNEKGLDLKNGHDSAVLRIREQGERIIFTLKKNRSNELDCIEKELDINNKEVMEDILMLLNYEKTVEVHKKRLKTNYKDYEICVDEVDGLGSFIEIEKMSEEDGLKIQDELFEFLQTLGVSKENRVLKGYDSLIWEKNNIY